MSLSRSRISPRNRNSGCESLTRGLFARSPEPPPAQLNLRFRQGNRWGRWRGVIAGIGAALLLASPAVAADKLTVLLDWFINPDHAPLVIAKEGGYFARHNLDV